MRITPPYAAVETWIWNDPRVRGLGQQARGLFGLLLTCPQMTKVPGLISGGTGALADEWKGTVLEFREVFGELQRAGLCEADWEARVVYVVPLLTEMVCNRPNGPSQAAAFGTVLFRLMPDCELTRRIDHDLRQLMLHSPALMGSYLRCRPLSNEDARQQAGRPLPQQPQQQSLLFPEAAMPEPALPQSGPAAGGESAAFLTMVDRGTDKADSSPALRLAEPDPEVELAEGIAELVVRAGGGLQLPSSGFTPIQHTNLRSQWRQAFAAGWRRKDLADLGTFIADGGLAWLKKTTPAQYIASLYLGDALARMERGRARPVAPPSRPAQPGAGARLRWSIDRFGKPDAVDDGAGDRFVCVIGDEWEREQLAAEYARYRRGERVTMADIRAAVAQPADPGQQDRREAG